jgi:hypothetical protein
MTKRIVLSDLKIVAMLCLASLSLIVSPIVVDNSVLTRLQRDELNHELCEKRVTMHLPDDGFTENTGLVRF